MHDIYKTKLSFSTSMSGYIRIDFEGESFPVKKDKMGNEIPYCVSMTKIQAELLIKNIQHILEEIEIDE